MKTQVLSLFDKSTLALQPWADAGYECHAYDAQHDGETTRGTITTHHADLFDEETLETIRARHAGKVAFVLAFPPCTDLSMAGARWFAKKRAANPTFMEEAAMRVREIDDLCDDLGAPYLIENPKSSMLNLLWRRHDHSFTPYEYGGYLNDDPTHPLWPHKIPDKDAYNKPTALWTSKDFVMPPTRPVEPVWVEFLAGRYADPENARKRRTSPLFFKTSAEVRSCTPRGFAAAVFAANFRES